MCLLSCVAFNDKKGPVLRNSEVSKTRVLLTTPANILFLPFNHQRTSERCKNQNEYHAETKTNHKTFKFSFV